MCDLNYLADSRERRNTPCQQYLTLGCQRIVYQPQKHLAGLPPAERLAGPVVELLGDGVQVLLGEDAQVGALREALPQQAVRVLVGAALPWRVWVAEVDAHVQRHRYLAVQRHLRALVSRQRVSHKLGKPRHLPGDGLLHLAGAVAVGQVQQDDVPARPLHQRAYGALVRGARYEVASPVARHGAVLHLGRPLGDHHHRLAEARLARVGGRPRPAGRVPAARLLGDIALELPLRLDVDGLVYGLGRCVHALIIGVFRREPMGDLLGAPMDVELGLDGRREHELDVVTPPGGQHLALPLVGDSCVFVSHQRPFPRSMVLRRSLESALVACWLKSVGRRSWVWN